MNVYEMINDKILALLEKGTVPWKKPWNANTNFPKNLVSKKEYQGINIFLLACSEFNSPYWMTFKQCQDKGGHVIKGSKSTPVIFWKWIDKKDSGEVNDVGKIPLLRYYSVFNIEQTEGIKPPDPVETNNVFDPIQRAEDIIFNMPKKPLIQQTGNRAFYNIRTDTVTLPPQHTFQSIEEYYSTCFHELTHSTMAEDRLNRKASIQVHKFGDEEYSKEELVAEMGSAFLCGYSGIESRTLENSAAYIAGWLKALKNDKTLLIHSAALAQKASDYILNTPQEDPAE